MGQDSIPDGRLPADGRIGRHFAASILVLVLFATYQLFSASVIAINAGYGFDGELYGRIAQNFAWDTLYRHVDSYRVQRILPSVIVGTALNVVGRHGVVDTIAGFRILTVALLALSAFGWCRICVRAGIGLRTFWTGFLLLFANFFVMNNAFYYPVLTDVAAFTLGVWMVHAYLGNSLYGLAAIGIAGSFVWPVCAPLSAILILFPRRCEERSAQSRLGTVPAVTLAVAAAGALVSAGIAVRFVLGRTTVGYGPVAAMNDAWLPASAVIHFGLLAVALFVLIRQLTPARAFAAVRAVTVLRWIVAAAVVLLPKVAIALIASDAKPTLPLTTFAAMLSFLPLVRPAVTPVAHFAYFGFAVPLLALNWRRMGAVAGSGGLGPVAFLALSVLFALTPESRQSVLTLPALVTILCRVIDRNVWGRWQIATLGMLQVLLARFWVDQNTGFAPHGAGTDILPTYFASQGPYMMTAPYGIFLLLLIVAIALCYLQRRSAGRGRAPA